jgi:hypothetical protein
MTRVGLSTYETLMAMQEQEALQRVETLVELLYLQPGDEDSDYGEVQAIPVTLTVLGVDPLSLMFAFKISSADPESLIVPEETALLIRTEKATFSCEDGFAWLSFYDLNSHSSVAIQELVERFAEALDKSELSISQGCVSCGFEHDVELLYIEGKCTRLCTTCLERRYEEREVEKDELNNPSLLHGFGLPIVFFFTAVGWGVFWFLSTILIRRLRIIEISYITTMLVGVISCGVGFCLGRPIGKFLRKSGFARKSPKIVSVCVVISACIIGEVFYIVLDVFKQVGVFDIRFAFQILVPVLQTYDPIWIVTKLLVVAAISVGCAVAAVPKQAELRL